MKRLLLLFCLAAPMFAAIPSGAVWEVRTTGSDLNGGCYVSGAGTDYSTSATAILAVSDADASGTTNLHSATGGFTSNMANNCLEINGGTLTAGVYYISAYVDSNNVTLDRAPGTGSGSAANVGGALATPYKASTLAVAGNTVWVLKGTYSVTANQPSFNPTGTSAVLHLVVSGYCTTRGDDCVGDTKPALTMSSGSTSITVLKALAAWVTLENFTVSCSVSNCTAVSISGAGDVARNISVTGFTLSGVSFGSGSKATRVSVTGGTGGNAFSSGAGTAWCDGCVAYGNATPGFISSSSSTLNCLYCISANNTGASSDGFSITSSVAPTLYGVVSYGNGRDGLRATNAAGLDVAMIKNSIFVNNVGVGVNSTVTDYTNAGINVNYNAIYGNGTNRVGFPTASHDFTLTGDPFVNGAGNDFTLNSTSGAGAVLRGAATPTIFPGIGTASYRDAGAVQHIDSGGASGGAYPIIGSINRYWRARANEAMGHYGPGAPPTIALLFGVGLLGMAFWRSR